MEEGQRQVKSMPPTHGSAVLILVVMEEGQRHGAGAYPIRVDFCRLNPCCNGRGSKTPQNGGAFPTTTVLILVVMEEGQRPSVFSRIVPVGLNPCCNGRGSKTGTYCVCTTREF